MTDRRPHPGKIHRLPEDLVNKIAAGEVVERPASVVKELVENAIDAEARTIQVEIEAGGKTLIRVRDDGWGMSRADAEQALERHATSKLRTLDDLQAVATHGFRGEALPSIASVSHLRLRTRDEGSPAGTEVESRHGRGLEVRDVGHPVGTTVEARDLFGGVPARRKFLRAESTEAAQVAEAVTLLALARPDIGFFLKSGGRTVLQAPPADALSARVYQIFGERYLEDLLAVEAGGEEWARVSGLVSRPDRPRPARPTLRLFVNHRPVRDRALAKAVAQAYQAAGAGERGTEAVLFVEVPPHMVDVNVHPAKTEVRFADSRTVFTAVERAVRQALSGGVRRAPRADTTRVEAAVQSFLAHPPAPGGARGAPFPEAVAEGQPGFPEPPRTVIGQHRNTYIVATDGEDLVLVDQHTAHERVRFERLLAQLSRGAAESQLLLAPQVVTLAPELQALLEAHGDSLQALGWDVEGFGGGATRVRAAPALLGGGDAGSALERLLRELKDRSEGEWVVSGARERLAAGLACHSAVRAGQGLSLEAMTRIVHDLGHTAHPTLCPHGRATTVRIPREEVSRWFGRTGWKRQ